LTKDESREELYWAGGIEQIRKKATHVYSSRKRQLIVLP
jgi:hypothetical protein